MVSRTLGWAAVMVTLCMAGPSFAQENLDAGKSPAQIFAGTCAACHKSPRGLLKSTAPGSLPGFLRQHYTTGPEMAGVLANYLISNGASDARSMGKPGKDGKSDAKPEAGGAEQPARTGRRHRPAASQAAPDGQASPQSKRDADGQAAAPAEAAPSGRKSKHKRGKPHGDDAAKPEAAIEQPSEVAATPREAPPR